MDGSEQFEYVHMRYIQMRLELGKEDDWETCGRDVKMHSMTDPTARIFFAVMKTGWTNSCHGASTSTSKAALPTVAHLLDNRIQSGRRAAPTGEGL